MPIREATPADLPQIIALAQQSSTAAHWSLREYDALFAPAAPKRLTLVAAEDQSASIAGFVIVRCMGYEWELENIVVAPQSRRNGLAEQLIRELLIRARRQKAEAILLEVRSSNFPALQLYGKFGFMECGRRRAYYSEPVEDALLLRLEFQSCDNTP